MKGVTIEVGSVEKPSIAYSAIKSIRAYISVMTAQKKRPQRVVVTKQQYAILHRAVNVKRDSDAPPVVGMTVDGVPLKQEGDA